jgi:hypothetical protein
LPGDADDDGGQDLWQEDDRPEGGQPADRVARQRGGDEQAQGDRSQGIEDDQDEGVEERLLDEAVGEGVDVVAQADPVGERDAVPVEQRDPRAIERGEQDEQPIQGERGEDVEEADQPGFARTPAGGGNPPLPAPEPEPITGQDGPCSSPSGPRP